MDDRLSVAVIGLGSSGETMARALSTREDVSLVAVADIDAARVDRIAVACNTAAFTDTRQLLLTTKPSAVFLAVPPTATADLLDACLEHRIHVWKEGPLARDLPQAVHYSQRFHDIGCVLSVGSPRRFSDAYRHARTWLDRMGTVRLARVHHLFYWQGQLGWRGDLATAGGGALLELGFHMIDATLSLLSAPEDVYGATTIIPPTAGSLLCQHDTDDSATAILRFRNNTTATVTLSRQAGPTSEGITLYGSDGSLTITHDACTLRNCDGEVLDHRPTDATPAEVTTRQIDAFCQAIAHDDTPNPAAAKTYLLTHATIQAIYLSCQTNQPESPRQQLQLYDADV